MNQTTKYIRNDRISLIKDVLKQVHLLFFVIFILKIYYNYEIHFNLTDKVRKEIIIIIW